MRGLREVRTPKVIACHSLHAPKNIADEVTDTRAGPRPRARAYQAFIKTIEAICSGRPNTGNQQRLTGRIPPKRSPLILQALLEYYEINTRSAVLLMRR